MTHQDHNTLKVNSFIPRVYMPPKNKRPKYNAARTIYKLKNDRFKFDYNIHPKINLILCAYFLNYKSTKEISLSIGKSAETVRKYILRSNCELRKCGVYSKISFTHEQELFLKQTYFMRPRLSFGVIIVRFNTRFNTKHTYATLQKKYKNMGLMY